MKKLIRLTFVILIFASVLAGCSSTNSNTAIALETAKIGVVTGTTGEAYARKELPESTVLGFSNVMEAVSALKANKLDTIITVDVTGVNIAKENPDLQALSDYRLTTEPICIAVAKENPQLLSEIDDIITQLKTDGTIADMEKRWIKIDLSPVQPVEIPEATGEVLKVGVAATYEPFNYIDNGKVVGLAPELAMRIGEKLGRRIEFTDMNFSALIAALQSGKIDVIISLITTTPEREKAVNFTQEYYTAGQVILKRQDTNIILPSAAVSKLSQLDGAGIKIGVPTGAKSDSVAREKFTKSEIIQYNNVSDGYLAVKTGKIDAFCFDEATMQYIVAQNPDLTLIPEVIAESELVAGTNKGNEELRDEVNTVIEKWQADGTIDEMKKRWMSDDLNPTMPQIESAQNPDRTIIVGTSYDNPPMNYWDENQNPTGFEVEFAKRLSKELNASIEIKTMDWLALIPSLSSDKIDLLIASLNYTEERAQKMALTQPYVGTDIVLLVKKDTSTGTKSGTKLQNSDFVGKKFAVITGTMLDKIVSDNLGNNEFLYFNTLQDAIEAVKNKKVDASINDEPILRKCVAENPELAIITPSLTKDEYGLVVCKDNPQLTAKLNEFFDKIKADGTYDEMIARWIDNKDTPDMPDIPLTAKNGTLKMATSALTEPFGFYGSDGKIIGFDIEYGRRFAQFMEMEFEVVDMDFGAIIPSVQSGKTDFGSSLITITEERAKSIDFTKPYYIGGTSIIVLGDTDDEKIGFIEGVKNSFYQNLIVENRYKMVLQGLWVTIIISVFSLILGTLLGFLICFLSMSKNKLLNWISKIYVGILRGTPMVVLLMIIFYIVFAKVDINPIIVAIIAFGLNGGAFIGEIIRSAILTVDKGQIEAARSMGFSSTGTFFIVTLPQAIRVGLPVYKSEFISMMKQTAIVGYIAIVDLTKVGDIIRSRTYDAFFPLIAVAVVYLITIGVFILLFDMLYKRTDKRQRRAKG